MLLVVTSLDEAMAMEELELMRPTHLLLAERERVRGGCYNNRHCRIVTVTPTDR